MGSKSLPDVSELEQEVTLGTCSEGMMVPLGLHTWRKMPHAWHERGGA